MRAFLQRIWARRGIRIALIAGAIVLAAGAAAAVPGWRYIKTDPDFCVRCHLMAEPAEKWRRSAHRNVACQTCHRADIFEEARLGWAAFIERKKEISPHARVPISICGECHLSEDPRWRQIAATPGHREHFGERGLSCLECHAVKVHEFAATTESCGRCHSGQRVALKEMETTHCFACHDFAGKRGAVELLPAAATCRECHPASAARPVPASEVVAAAKATPAPVGKGHEDCLQCHKPHGAKLRDPVDCMACHLKVLDPQNPHYKDERLQGCLECHAPHEAR